MTLDEYLKSMRDRLDLFEKQWRALNLDNETSHPLELPSYEDWDEQFELGW